MLASGNTGSKFPSSPEATTAIALPKLLVVPHTLLCARAGQVDAQELRSTSAMRASHDIRELTGQLAAGCASRRLGPQPDRRPLRRSRSSLPHPVYLTGILASADVYDPSHPCQRTLALFTANPMFMSGVKLGKAQDRLHRLAVPFSPVILWTWWLTRGSSFAEIIGIQRRLIVPMLAQTVLWLCKRVRIVSWSRVFARDRSLFPNLRSLG